MAKKTRLAVQLYSMRDHMQTPPDMKKTFRRLAKMGYTAAQISGVGPIDPAELNKMMVGEGIQPIGAHVGLKEFREDLGKVIADCHAWGISHVAIPALPGEERDTAAKWKKLAREFTKLGKKCKAEGITLQYHNHMFEFQKLGIKKGRGGELGLDLLYDNSDPEFLQAELDLGWVARGGHDPIRWGKKVAGRMDQVHLKDWGVVDNQPVWRAIGEGGIDWAPVLKECKKAGTVEYIIEQDNCPVTNDPFLSMQISYENLSALGMK